SKIAPAHVPQTGLVFTNSLKGSNKPDIRAKSAIVVDSPPGMIRASHAAKSEGVLTSFDFDAPRTLLEELIERDVHPVTLNETRGMVNKRKSRQRKSKQKKTQTKFPMPPTKKRKLNTEIQSKSPLSESDDDRQMSDIEESREEEEWLSESE
ncbi:644_t:CDS:2, partial [Acaulospora colombiana]